MNTITILSNSAVGINHDTFTADDKLVNKYLNFELPQIPLDANIKDRHVSKFNLLEWEAKLFDFIDNSDNLSIYQLLYKDLPSLSLEFKDKIAMILQKSIARAARATTATSVKVMKLLLFFCAGNEIKFIFFGFDAPLFHAVCVQNVEMVEFLLTNYSLTTNLLQQKNNFNNVFPLNRAAALGNIEICNLLIDKGFNVNNYSSGKSTPLFHAASNAKVLVVKLLLKHGAEPNACTTGQDTPLYQAALRGHADVVRALIVAGADINCGTTGEDTAIYAAVKNNHKFVVKLLLAKGLRCISNVNVRSTGISTPIYCAVQDNNLEMVKILLKNKVNMITHNSSEDTLCQVALKNGSYEMVNLLLSYRNKHTVKT